jgi:hypothetical protein
VVKLLDYANVVPALESNANPFAAVVLAHLKTQETRHDLDARRVWKVRIVKGLFERGLRPDAIRQLFRFIDWMMDLPKALERLYYEEIQQLEKEKTMPYLTTPERIGLERGREEGLRQGLLAGIEQLLEVKFGAEGLNLLPEIRQLSEVEKLQAILHAIRTAGTTNELRRIWATT